MSVKGKPSATIQRSQESWQNHFAIDDVTLKTYEASAKKEQRDTLAWCLITKRLPEEEYLAWAMETYGIPLVTDDFFAAAFDDEPWQSQKENQTWSRSFFPLAEWEGCLLIGCLEPRENLPLSQPYRFVLASAHQLDLLWQKLKPAIQAPASSPSSVQHEKAIELVSAPVSSSASAFEMPEGLALPSTPSAKSDSFSFDNLKISNDASSSGESFSGMPEGLSLPGLSNLAAPPASSLAIDLPSTDMTSSAMPEGLSFGLSSPASHTSSAYPQPMPIPMTPPPPEFVADVQPEMLSSDTNPPEVQATAPEAEMASPATEMSEPQEPPALEPAQASADDQESSLSENTGVIVSQIYEKTVADATSRSEVGVIGLVHLLKHFDGAMILVWENGRLRTWKWSDLLTSTLNRELPVIETETPSMFRIVQKSRQPFHGPPAKSPVNNAFAHAFCGGQLPPCVSIMPILENQKVIGMVLGISRQAPSFKSIYGPVSRVADAIGAGLMKFPAEKKSAA